MINHTILYPPEVSNGLISLTALLNTQYIPTKANKIILNFCLFILLIAEFRSGEKRINKR